jgi:hypothetical protein
LNHPGGGVSTPPDILFLDEPSSGLDPISAYLIDKLILELRESLGATVVIPCTMGTLGRIAHGLSDDLLLRAADVALKERRKLILVPRETPLNLVHVRNMELLLLAGAILLPANPSFYGQPQTIAEVVDTDIAFNPGSRITSHEASCDLVPFNDGHLAARFRQCNGCCHASYSRTNDEDIVRKRHSGPGPDFQNSDGLPEAHEQDPLAVKKDITASSEGTSHGLQGVPAPANLTAK